MAPGIICPIINNKSIVNINLIFPYLGSFLPSIEVNILSDSSFSEKAPSNASKPINAKIPISASDYILCFCISQYPIKNPPLSGD